MIAWLYAGFVVFIVTVLVLDLFVFNRRAHEIRARVALGWTAFFVSMALSFSVAVYFMYEHHWLGLGQHALPDGTTTTTSGKKAAFDFLTGWLVEYSLSLDNLFVIALVFRYFAVPPKYQHRVLFWGIMGALVMRGVMIAAGAALVSTFHWVIYVFAVILLFTAVRLLFMGDEGVEPERNPLVRLARRMLPFTESYDGQRFFTRTAPAPDAPPGVRGRLVATPMFLVLLVVESTDVVFAVDSIPAIFVITQDPFLVFTSNAFAILGLRSLYFALAAVMQKLRYLKVSMVVVLIFIALKMLAEIVHVKVPTEISLLIVALIMGAGVGASLIVPLRTRREPHTAADELVELADLTWRNSKRLVIAVIGGTVVLIGLLLSVPLVPGPGFLVVIAGLAILATEFVWAKRMLKRARAEANALMRRAQSLMGISPATPEAPPAESPPPAGPQPSTPQHGQPAEPADARRAGG